jgi:hypothetical protein
MTKVASYLSRKIGRSTRLINGAGVGPPKQHGSGGKLFDGGGELTIRQMQPEDQKPLLGLIGSSSGAQVQQTKAHH